jgi:hypothetical protein
MYVPVISRYWLKWTVDLYRIQKSETSNCWCFQYSRVCSPVPQKEHNRPHRTTTLCNTTLVVHPMGNSLITPDIKRSILREDGTKLDFFTALGGNGGIGGNCEKLRDEDVVNIINDDDVNPASLTRHSLPLLIHVPI